jgi:hypothetical protein
MNLIPTATDLIINNNLFQPHGHEKLAANYLTNRKNTYPLTREIKYLERNSVCEILKEDEHPQQTIWQKVKRPLITPKQGQQNQE